MIRPASSPFQLHNASAGQSSYRAQSSGLPPVIIANNTPQRLLPSHIKEHIQHLQQDNAGLLRRLNTVHQELERLSREKATFQQQLGSLMQDTTVSYDKLQSQDDLDKVNKYMKDDLNYERERNAKLQRTLQDLQSTVDSLSNQLSLNQSDQQMFLQQNQEAQYLLQKTLTEIGDLQKEQGVNADRLRDGDTMTQELGTQCRHYGQDIGSLQHAIELIIAERNRIIDRTGELAREFEDVMKHITDEKRMIEAQNRNQAKSITAKLLFNLLCDMHRNRMIQGFQEIATYTQFDAKCNEKLKFLSVLLERTGKQKLQISLTHWFSAALKPIEVMDQSKLLSLQQGRLLSVQKFYRKWREVYRDRIRSYELKTLAINKIWDRLRREANIEKQRAYRIWKEAFGKFKLQKYHLKRILWRKCFKQAGFAFSAWQNHSSYFESQVRLNLLAVDFAHQQQLTVLFRNFHIQTTQNKQKRLSTLAHCMVNWRHYIEKQRYMMAQGILTERFKQEVFTSTVKGTFDAMKQYKQRKMLQKTEDESRIEQATIAELDLINEEIRGQRHQLEKYRACEIIKIAQSKRLWSYIDHWRKVNLDYQEKLRTTLKDKLIKLYMQTMRAAFCHWSLRDSQEITVARVTHNDTLTSDNTALQNRVIDLNASIAFNQEERMQMKNKHLLKCIQAFDTRFVSIAMGRWRDKCISFNSKEDGAAKIIRRLRLRLVRKAFDLYLEGVKNLQTIELHENRCLQYEKTRANRISALTLTAWLNFKQQHQRAKAYWYRIFLRLDMSQKRQTIKQWRENTQALAEESLSKQESETLQVNEDKNQEIGQLNGVETSQQLILSERIRLLRKQGQLILANSFARFKSTNQTRGLEKWKDYVLFERNRERILAKAVSHQRKNQFYVVKSAFKNWIQHNEILARAEQVKKEISRVNDTIFQANLQNTQFQDNSKQRIEAIAEEHEEQRILSLKHQNCCQLIVKRVNSNHFTGQKQYIFTQWSNYVKREVYFINCIKRICEKSLFDQGFQAIKNAARENLRANTQEVLLTNFFNSFKHRVLLNSFSNWRACDYKKVKDDTDLNNRTIQDLQDKHLARKTLIKNHNAQRAEGLITDFLKRNIIQAWRNVIAHLKLLKSKTLLCHAENTKHQQTMSLLKWHSRTRKTHECRLKLLRAQERVTRLRMSAVFEGMKKQYYRSKEFMKRIGNLARVMDHQQIQVSFQAIQSFSKAKAFAFQKRKENSTIWLAESLQEIFIKRMQQYLSSLRSRLLNKRKRDTLHTLILSQAHTQRIRTALLRWREAAEKLSLQKQLYDEGPVREQDFGYRSELKNIKHLMKAEGYDEGEMEGALRIESDKQRGLILKAVQRMKHYNQEGYLKPKMWDRWRDYVAARKRVKYWVQFVEKRAHFGKSDLHKVFDTWKRFHGKRKQALTAESKQDLGRRAVGNSKTLDKMSEEITDKENMVDHLTAQRDTLMDNYIKAQRLALALCKNNHRNSMHQAFSQWCETIKTTRNLESKTALQANLAHMEALKLRIKLLESQNEGLGNENEELRQFSLDGYDIAKNVQILSSEREILSVDLADKAQVIRKLLDENETLTLKLEKIQQYAENLIKATMKRERPASSSNTFARNSYR